MKLYALRLCSVVAVVAASATSACSLPGKSQTTTTSIPQPSVTSTPVNTQGENRPASPTPKGAAYLSDDIKIVAVELKEQDARLGYEIEISYPQIDIPRTPQERKFNLYVRKMIESDVKDFKAFCSKKRKYPDGSERRGGYHMGTSYDVLYAAPGLLSIDLKMESFTGYVNADWFTIPLNYDLKAGRPLRLANLFKPKSKFFEAIASYCVSELERLGLECGGVGGGKIIDEHTFREGTLPKAENYAGWNLTRDGIQITFGEYQIGPGCLGLVRVVVPYDHLKGILRDDVEWLHPLQPNNGMRRTRN